jgi:hypothetical protein
MKVYDSNERGIAEKIYIGEQYKPDFPVRKSSWDNYYDTDTTLDCGIRQEERK